MQGHEYFEQLCALAIVGPLQADESSELLEHLRDCAHCRELVRQFDSVLLDTLAVAKTSFADALGQLRISDSGYRERFLERARREGLTLPASCRRRLATLFFWLKTNPVFVSIVLIGAFGLAAVGFFLGHYALQRQGHKASLIPPQTVAVTQERLEQALEDKGKAERSLSDLQQQDSLDLQRVQAVGQQNLEYIERIHQLEVQLAKSESALTKASSTVLQLQDQLQDQGRVLVATKQEADEARRGRQELEASMVEQQTRLNTLNEEVKVETASLEMERKLVSVGRDVRDLMGARDLHIVDVHDFNSTGKQESAFGRIFFTRGKSLVFYAFDLNEKKSMDAKASFQVWGQRLGSKESTRSLGILYVDDEAQRRWALKVSDPNLLKEIDTVFVTLEKHHGSKEPTGSPLMHAFLGSEPNHP